MKIKTMNFKAVCVFLALLGGSPMIAQQVVAPGGDYKETSSGSLSWTLGELVIDSYSSNSIILTQGFQQSSIKITAVSELAGGDFKIYAFPNPVADFVQLEVSGCKAVSLKYTLCDINGKTLEQKPVQSNHFKIDLSAYTKGCYVLKVMQGNKELKTFKIVKQ